MNKFRLLLYANDPRDGAQPNAAYEAVAESGGYATRMLIDSLERFPWCQIDAIDSGNADSQTDTWLIKVA
jgi:hypothetical protein